MALSITSISPAVGVTSGQTRVVIEGTDFDIHPFPPTQTGYVGDSLGPSVKVTLDGQEAERVWVYIKPGAPTVTVIECSTPRYVGDHKALPNLVDVIVENLINPGSVTSTDGFKYEHPDATESSILSLVMKAFASEILRQIPFGQVSFRVHTDYDSDVGDDLDLVDIADTPTLLIQGPKLTRTTEGYQAGQDIDENADPLLWTQLRAMTAYDLTFDLIAVDKSDLRLSSYVSMLTMFAQDNGELRVELVSGDPSQGFREFDLAELSPMEMNQQGNNSNLSTATGSFIVRGVTIERLAGVTLQKAIQLGVEDVNITIEQLGC